ncbi:unnamed protein product [Prorocentrum cordatum]|nr:unnamed protein product [Polarella glacialis]
MFARRAARGASLLRAPRPARRAAGGPGAARHGPGQGAEAEAAHGGSRYLKTLGASISFELVVGGALGLALLDYCLRSGGETAESEDEVRKRDAAWRQQAAALRAFYAAQPAGEKAPPEEGTDLARFVFSNQRLHRMPLGLPAWKAQELESIEGWSWRITRART